MVKSIKKSIKNSFPDLYTFFLKINFDIQSYFAKKVLSYTSKDFMEISGLSQPFFIVLIPGSLHIFELWLKFLPSNVDIVLILNGLDSWELSWLKERINAPTITIKRMVDHGKIIDLILDHFPKPFGLIDYDCFVFNKSFFENIKKIPDQTLTNSVFHWHDEMLNIDIPGTYFMFLNPKEINKIRGEYRSNCRTAYYCQLSNKIKNQLSILGMNNNGRLMNNHSIFDTMHVVVALGISQGKSINFLEQYNNESQRFEDIIHIGSVSTPNKINSMYSLRGSLFWRKALEAHPSGELRQHYYKLFGEKTSEELIREHPERYKRISQDFLNTIDRLIKSSY